MLDQDLFVKAGLASVGRAAPQKIARVEHSGIGSHHDSVDLIGFDPALDFTVRPWLVEKINRDMRQGDVILGAARDAALGSELLISAIRTRSTAGWARPASAPMSAACS